MEKHIRTHPKEKERKFQCKICSLKFLTKKSLQGHEYRHNQKEKGEIQCQFCMKKFNWKSDFNIKTREVPEMRSLRFLVQEQKTAGDSLEEKAHGS
jgi:transcription elongation factor Elf1